ncbi:MAG: acyl carrier protein [Roseiflexus sp.]|nr:acyl carrier protein [Roseiflexus sp.]MCS7289787.1 acyl carrier protein [Roseiflexus sp.]MDW8232498.1 acyl carrier protein [Roseiflexaceae bacterium]
MQLTAMDISSQIRSYITHNLLFGDEGFVYSDDDSFLERGIVDSLGVIELVSFIETQFGISVADHELTPDNFDSVKKLSEYVVRKLANGAQEAVAVSAPLSSIALGETYARP